MLRMRIRQVENVGITASYVENKIFLVPGLLFLLSHLAGETYAHAYVYITACSCEVRWNDKTCCRWKQGASSGSRYQLDARARATCQCRVQMALKASRQLQTTRRVVTLQIGVRGK